MKTYSIKLAIFLLSLSIASCGLDNSLSIGGEIDDSGTVDKGKDGSNGGADGEDKDSGGDDNGGADGGDKDSGSDGSGGSDGGDKDSGSDGNGGSDGGDKDSGSDDNGGADGGDKDSGSDGNGGTGGGDKDSGSDGNGGTGGGDKDSGSDDNGGADGGDKDSGSDDNGGTDGEDKDSGSDGNGGADGEDKDSGSDDNGGADGGDKDSGSDDNGGADGGDKDSGSDGNGGADGEDKDSGSDDNGGADGGDKDSGSDGNGGADGGDKDSGSDGNGGTDGEDKDSGSDGNGGTDGEDKDSGSDGNGGTDGEDKDSGSDGNGGTDGGDKDSGSDDNGGTDGEDDGDSQTPTTLPSIPANVKAVAGYKKVTLNWDDQKTADSYSIYWHTSSLVTTKAYTGKVTTTSTSQIISNLNNGTTYHFVLTAHKLDIESKASEAIAATPIAFKKTSLNDTGINWGGVYYPAGISTCTSNITSAPQDCSHGRDAEAAAGKLKKVGAGSAGFDFTKLGIKGNELIIQNGKWSDTGNESAGTRWSCVRDNVTGLVWEVKVATGNADSTSGIQAGISKNIHHKDNFYRWGGISAIGRSHDDREGTYYDDWNGLVNGSNNANFCGYNDWRVPNIVELTSIVDYDRLSYPRIDIDYFPNASKVVWTSSPGSSNADYAWRVIFSYGSDTSYRYRKDARRVRLVRGGQ